MSGIDDEVAASSKLSDPEEDEVGEQKCNYNERREVAY